jgi:hypothetical protein
MRHSAPRPNDQGRDPMRQPRMIKQRAGLALTSPALA